MARSFFFLFGLVAAVGAADIPFKFPDQFSAGQTILAEGQTMKSKVYAGDSRTRVELAMGGMEIITISRRDLKVAWSLMPAQKMYIEIPLKEDPTRSEPWKNPAAKIESAGAETIRGQPCNKYKISVENTVMFLWFDAMTNLPVRQSAADGTLTIDWENFQEGPQPADIFEVPPGYKKMEMPAGMPGMN